MQENVLTQRVQLRADAKEGFADWQALINAKLTAFPGFVSLEFMNLSNSSFEWLIVQRFSNPDELTNWLMSNDFIDLKKKLSKEFAQGEIKEELSSTSESRDYVTEVFVTEVSPSKEKDFRNWIAKIHQAEAQFPGFKGVYVQAPTKVGGKNWLTLLQFDTQANLDQWLNSPNRNEILKESKSLISSLETHRIISPFAGWFKSFEEISGEAPQVWKQSMIVLLVLFPIVMLEMKYLNPLTHGINLSLAVFIGNAISVSLVSWPLVPIVIYCMRWWLAPKEDIYQRNTVIGTGVIILLYIIEVLAFW